MFEGDEFDPTDPYDTLLQHERMIFHAHSNILKITEHLDERTKFIVELTEEFNQVVKIVNQQSKLIESLSNRITLLEVARQYENK